MKDSNENINLSQNDLEENKQKTLNSSKLLVSHLSTKETTKRSPSNYIQRTSPILPKSIYNMDLSKEERNSFNNNNQNSNMYYLPTYTPLTPQLLPKDHKHHSKKNFPSKEEVCKGNPNYSQKMKIPTSSPITQYFNLDNYFNNDFGFQLENKNGVETRLSQMSNTSQSDKYNCSPSEIFNRKTINDLGKSFKGINIIEENDEDNNKNEEDDGFDLFAMNMENNSEDNNFVDDENNDILTKIKDIKKKKLNKPKSYNNSKQSKNTSKKNNNDNNINEIKNDKPQEKINKEEIKIKDSLNIINNITEKKKLEKNNNEIKDIIKEENNAYFIPKDLTKNLNELLDKSEINVNQSKEEDENIKTDKLKDEINNNETNNLNYNNKLINNNMSNFKPQANDNLKYINNMNINCNNISINNYSNMNQNFKNMNMNNLNQQQLLYLMKYNNGQITMGNNGLNNFNNIYNSINNNNFGQNYNQMKGIYMNLNNPYFPQNNINPNYTFFNNINNANMNNNNNSNNNIKNNINNNTNNKMNNQQKNDFKKKKPKKLDNSFYMDKPLSFLGDNINMLSKDQGACRYLQNLLETNPQETLNYLYKPLCSNILLLINDPFGNYLIQKIIIYLNEDQLYEILNIISRFFSEICNNIYGTRVIQTIIDNLKTPKVRNYFFQLLKPVVIHLLKELNGTFVVQKFSKMYEEYTNAISDIIIEGSHILSTHRHGCCVIQKYLELNDPYLVPKLIDKLLDKSLLLIVDQFGNYVIQTILKKNNKNYGNKLAEKIVDNVVYYAKHKYSSNVVEKCFNYCDDIYLSNLINNVLKKDNLIELMLDEHGNYVVQKVISLSNFITQRQILKIIMQNIDKLKSCNHGERVINRLSANYPFINDKDFIDEINQK